MNAVLAAVLAFFARPAVRLGAMVALLAIIGTLAALLGPSGRDEFADWVGTGWAGPLLFVVLYMVMTVLLLPGSAGTLAAGALYGIVFGAALTVVAATLGAVAAFAISRRFGQLAARQLSGERLRAVDARLSTNGLRNMLIVRLLPIVPFNALNYAAGLTSISTRDYVLGTAVGIIPGTVAFTAVGANAHDPGGLPFLLSLGALAALIIASAALARRSRSPHV